MNLKIDLSRQTNFVLAILLVYFLFFGYIANVFLKEVGLRLIFLHHILFNPETYISTIILSLIIFFMVYREDFFQFGLRNAIWIIPIIIGISWIWYWIIYGFDIMIIIIFFINLEGYITLLSLFGINFVTAIIASYIKILILKRKKELDKIQYFNISKGE